VKNVIIGQAVWTALYHWWCARMCSTWNEVTVRSGRVDLCWGCLPSEHPDFSYQL